MRHAKKQESVTHTHKFKQLIKTIFECTQMLDLAHKNFKVDITIFKELKENMFKELQENGNNESNTFNRDR